MRIRRAPGLQAHAVDGDIRLRSSISNAWYRGHIKATTLRCIIAFSDWTEFPDAAKRIAELTALSLPGAEKGVRELIKAGILVEDTPEQIQLSEAEDRWTSNGWRNAFDYHLTSDSVEHVDYTTQDGQKTDISRMYAQREATPAPPSNYLNRSVSAVALPPARSILGAIPSSALGAIPSSASTSPKAASSEFATSPEWITSQQASDYLWYSFGQIGSKRLPVSGDHVRKTSPSGGSRHPTEAYIIPHTAGGHDLEEPHRGSSAIYHYCVKDHSLERLTTQVTHDWVEKYILEKPEWATESTFATVVLTSRVERNMHRYRESFSYRPIHHDVGHVLETSTTVAHALGINTFVGYSTFEAEVDRIVSEGSLIEPTIAFIQLRGTGF